MSWTGESESIRYAELDDLDAVADMLQDPEVGRWLWFCPISREGVADYFSPLLEAQRAEIDAGRIPPRAVLVVEDLEGRFLGEGGVIQVDGSPGGFEIGYQLRREAWGRGVGSRLAWFLSAFAVLRQRAYRVEASCMEGNVASRRILEGLGLRLEGSRSGYRLKGDARHDELLYGAESRYLDRACLARVARDFGLD